MTGWLTVVSIVVGMACSVATTVAMVWAYMIQPLRKQVAHLQADHDALKERPDA